MIRHQLKENSKKLKGLLTANEVKDAEDAAINHLQQSMFYAEFNSLKQKKPITDSKLTQPKHQIILPKKHLISKLIVRNIHNRGHMVTKYVLSTLRQKYWMVKVRSTIKRIASRCSFCKR